VVLLLETTSAAKPGNCIAVVTVANHFNTVRRESLVNVASALASLVTEELLIFMI
jgi:hypothetical protein